MGAATIGDDALIGMGSQVGDGVVVEEGGCIGARARVEPGTVVKAGWIWAGRPALAFRAIKPEEREAFARGGADLRRLRRRVSPRQVARAAAPPYNRFAARPHSPSARSHR